jgi:hypothetical protein
MTIHTLGPVSPSKEVERKILHGNAKAMFKI